MNKVKLIAFFLVIGVTACNNSQFTAEIETVDSLKTELKEAEIRLDSIDQKKLVELSTNATEQLIFIQKNYQDTITKDLAALLGFYKTTYRNMEKLINKARHTQEELEKSSEQLENLRTDLANNLIPADSVKLYIEKEAEITEEISESSKKWIEAQERYISHYDGISTRVDSLLEVMKQNGMR